jgi:two-component system sensor histidine kinase KdpD
VSDALASGLGSGPAAGPEGSLLVCVGEGADGVGIVEAGRRLAERLRTPWTVLHVSTPGDDGLSEEEKDRIAAALGLAARLGAGTVTLPAQVDVVGEILAYAAAHSATILVLGQPRGGRRRGPFGEPVADGVVRQADGFEVIFVPRQAAPRNSATSRPKLAPARRISWRDLAWANAGVAVATVTAAALENTVSNPHLSLILLTAVLLIAARLGVWPALYASGLSFLVFAFFFAPPYYSVLAVNPQDMVTLTLFLLVATLTGNLAGRLKRKVDSLHVAARTTNNLYELSRKVAAAGSLDDVLRAAAEHIASALECRSLILLPQGGALEVAQAFPPDYRLDPGDRSSAERAWREPEPPGAEAGGVATEPGPFVALRTRRGTVGVLGLGYEGRAALSTEQRRLFYAMADQVAVAIERTRLMMDIEQVRLRDETEHLRAALLSSVSHDLKTPLVSIIGSATALADATVKLPEESRLSLIQAILEEAQRLHRFVQNLLDMTQLSYGKLTISRRWCELGEIVNRARRQTEKMLARHRLDVRLPDDLPEILVDPVLIEHVLVNLLDNAAKYAPAGSRVEIAASSAEGRIELVVTDEGPGIAEAEREAVFDQFYRARAEDRQTAGTGLGLSICRGLVDAHGGTIAIAAGPGGRGARVTVTLPLEAAGHGAPAPEEPTKEEPEP